jgi:galactose mutarotase-like enzyme
MAKADDPAGVTLVSGPLEVAFLPDVGMLGVALRHRGDDLLALPGGLAGYRAGHVTGLPLLAPWANRLGERRYAVGDVEVDTTGLDLPTDGRGLAIHGTMTAQPGWEVVARDERSLEARFDYGARPDLLAAFPFPHELRIAASLDPEGLTMTTTVASTGDGAVPVAFGYHPYLRLPGVARSDVRLRLPARGHLALDDRQLPTGAVHAEEAEDSPIGDRTFDDLYELGEDRELALTGGGRRVGVELGDGYRYAQVFAPPGAETVCLEPMTAPGNALVDGGYALAPPGAPFTATFRVGVADAPRS